LATSSMTLPQGFKTFTDGTVLTADEINGYLQQGILVFDDASARTTALTGNLREGMYSYLKSDNTTYVYDGTAWQRVGKQDVETEKNFQAFTGSGGTTVPAWATKMYYCVVRGGNSGAAGPSGGPGQPGAAGGQVLQGDTAVTGGTSLTITVGGAAANSSVAISGGSTFTASTTGAAGGSGPAVGVDSAGGGTGANGTLPSAPFNVSIFGGGGGGGSNQNFGQPGGGGSVGGGKGGAPNGSGQAGSANTGGGGGGGGQNGAGGTGGSGIVLLYFS
jgi:hypothetical protein